MQPAAPDSPLIAMTRNMECASTANWVHITGTIQSYGSQPLCAMVLSNGEQMFTCDDSLGKYDLTVPVDDNGQVTVFGFADGFQPYSETFIAPKCDVRTATADGGQFQYYIADAQAGPYTFCTLFVTVTNTTEEKKTCGLVITAYDTSDRNGTKFSRVVI
jgi:hypothetical protein